MKIGEVTIEPGIMNAACSVAKTLDDVRALTNSSVGGITIGSITVKRRQGNPEPRWYTRGNCTLNSFGMPNEGIAFYRAHLPEMLKIAHNNGKKLSLSIAGFSTLEYVELAQLADSAHVDLLELNLGCPNVTIDGKQKPIASFDPATITEIIDAVSHVTNMPLFLKLSPYSNPAELERVAETISKSGKVSAVVTSNTFANSIALEEGRPVLATHLGGLSGHGLLPISLGQVWQFRKLLPDHIAVVGVGGIESIHDVEQYIQAGASGVQVATLIVRDGHNALERLIK